MFLLTFLGFLIFLNLMTKSFHLLSFFISMEMISVILLLSFSILFMFHFLNIFVILLLLCILASESVLGLLLFVLFSRFFSKDYYLMLGSSKF